MYKLVALDMDGTLLNPDGRISAANQAAIAAARAHGVTVVLASGRPLTGMGWALEQLQMTGEQDYVLSFNGALIQQVGGGRVLYRQTLQVADACQLLALSRELGVYCHAFTEQHGLVTPQDNPYTRMEQTENRIPLTELDFACLAPTDAVAKVMMVGEPGQLDRAQAALPPWVRERYTVLRSMPVFLEFLHPACNKGEGVARLARHLGIPATQVICVGDGGNDTHMLEFAGLGVAMGNATDELKALADYVTHSHAEDGVAHVLERFILEPADQSHSTALEHHP